MFRKTFIALLFIVGSFVSFDAVQAASGYPDLIISKIEVGSTGSFKVYMKNQGDTNVSSTATGVTKIVIYNEDGSIYKNYNYAWSTLKNKDFYNAGGESYISPIKLDCTKNYRVEAYVDSTYKVNEGGTTEENNNSKSLEFRQCSDLLEVPVDAIDIKGLTFYVTAPKDKDLTITAVNLYYAGTSEIELDDVRLTYNNQTLGNDVSFVDGKAYVDFGADDLTVKMGQTVKLEARYSLEDYAEAARYHQIYIKSASDIVSNVAPTNYFPAYGMEVFVINDSFGQAIFEKSGEDSEIRFASLSRIGEFKISNESTEDDDMNLFSIALENNGSAKLDEVVQNIYITNSAGTIVSNKIIQSDGDDVYFEFLNGGYELLDGDTEKFSIYAEIVSDYEDVGDTIQFEAEEDYSLIIYSDETREYAVSVEFEDETLAEYTIQ